MAGGQPSLLLVFGFTLGMAGSAASGCIIPDYCIELQAPGRDWCRALDGAKMWPNGMPELAEAIKDENGGVPVGCHCFNDAEQDVLIDETPQSHHEYLAGLVTKAARQECSLLVPVGYDHNCFESGGAESPVPLLLLPGELSLDCFGSCAYANPPPHGGCDEKNPYECNEESGFGGNDEVDDAETTESDAGDTGTTSDTGVIQTPHSRQP